MRWKLNSSAYKRVPSRDATMDRDVETPGVKMTDGGAGGGPSWRISLPHVCVATLTSFLFGYHSAVVNEPLESISTNLGFAGNTLAEGLVVSICLGGAFVGCLFSGSIADGIGRRRAFQLSALPMIIGAAISALTNSLEGMLVGRFLVGTGMGLGPPVASLYITEVSPPSVRGTYGSFVQIATCLGIIVSLLIGTPVKDIDRWWRVCFWVAVAPATLQALGMEFCAESPQWLYKCGRTSEAEMQFEKLLGPLHVKSAMAELSRSERGDDGESVKYSELIYGRHFNVVFIGTTLFALQQLSGINSVFYFSSTVFRSVGVPSNLANICMGIANLSGSNVVLCIPSDDKIGLQVCKRYKQYHQQMQMVVSSFESVPGLSCATPYASSVLKAISRHFRRVRSIISSQIQYMSRLLGEELLSLPSSSSGGKAVARSLGLTDQSQPVWRPQRGLPERAVSVLRAWLFDHFLHPYPTDADKHMLAAQTGLSRNQVSNWFINARVRLWKPMVEEIHMLETRGSANTNASSDRSNPGAATLSNHTAGPLPLPVAAGGHQQQQMLEQCLDVAPPPMGIQVGGGGQLMMSFGAAPFAGAADMGGLGAVSLTLGLRRDVSYHQQQQFGGHILGDLVG